MRHHERGISLCGSGGGTHSGNGRLSSSPRSRPDAIVIGSGFGGTMAALGLVEAGMRVLMLERGDWVERGDHNRDLGVHWNTRSGYSLESPYALEGASRKALGAFHCVGGPSVFYGGVALRMRVEDFRAHREISGDLRWPFEYPDLEPHFEHAERLLGVAGQVDDDPTGPPRRAPLPPPHLELSRTSSVLWNAAARLGLHPFRLPLALNGGADSARPVCSGCGICDGFACSTGAKNDLASAVLPRLLARGLELRANTVATSLEARGGRVVAVRCFDRLSGQALTLEADRFVVAAGALATPHLLLASGLQHANPAGDAVGRYLMRHCNGIVVGASAAPAGAPDEFRKQLGLHDFYEGDTRAGIEGRLGGIQQVRATQIALLMTPLPAPLKRRVAPLLERLVGFIVIAEDQPHPENRVYLDPVARDRFGRPVARVHHRHTPRDLAARRALSARSEEVLREAGCAFTLRVPVNTFSHGLGSVRMGEDPRRFPVDPEGRFRGTENLWISDGSVFPTSGAVNPSLSIAANALRIATGIASARRVAPRSLPVRSAPYWPDRRGQRSRV